MLTKGAETLKGKDVQTFKSLAVQHFLSRNSMILKILRRVLKLQINFSKQILTIHKLWHLRHYFNQTLVNKQKHYKQQELL